MYYDFLGRLMRVYDSSGCSYEYTYDANNNMVSMRHSAEASFRTSYTYDKDSRETKVDAFGHTRTTHYDKFGRVTERVWNEGADGQYKSIYKYMDSGNNRYGLVKQVMNGEKTTDYTYDANGNIASIKDSAGASKFYYDKRNQLIREDNCLQNKTFAYGYDLGGNMTRIREYAYTTASTLPDTPVKTITGTYDSTWKDKLITWNGVSLAYDKAGNLTKKGSATYTWTEGRKLAGASNGKTIQYAYDHTGNRIRKTVDGTETNYRMAGDLLASQQKGTQVTYFAYDSSGTLVAMAANNQWYFYVRNAQNDITGMIDASGNLVVEYKYDSWGKILSITGSKASDIGAHNPFRYRGYYYDDETGMYYLKSRYYDPDLKRFINADRYMSTGRGMGCCNMYVYCENNPVDRMDFSGQCWFDAKGNWCHDNWEYIGDYKRKPRPSGNVDITWRLNNTMRKNAKDLRNYRKENGFVEAVLYFIKKVKTQGDWDLKNQTSWKFSDNVTYWYNNSQIRQDDIGNIHYGYVGRELFGAVTLVLGGGAYQIKSDFPNIQWNYWYAAFDDPQDQLMVLTGTILWDIDMRNF